MLPILGLTDACAVVRSPLYTTNNSILYIPTAGGSGLDAVSMSVFHVALSEYVLSLSRSASTLRGIDALIKLGIRDQRLRNAYLSCSVRLGENPVVQCEQR